MYVIDTKRSFGESERANPRPPSQVYSFFTATFIKYTVWTHPYDENSVPPYAFAREIRHSHLSKGVTLKTKNEGAKAFFFCSEE